MKTLVYTRERLLQLYNPQSMPNTIEKLFKEFPKDFTSYPNPPQPINHPRPPANDIISQIFIHLHFFTIKKKIPLYTRFPKNQAKKTKIHIFPVVYPNQVNSTNKEKETKQKNPFLVFSQDENIRNWYFKDENGEIKGPFDAMFMDSFRRSNKISEETKIAFGNTDKFVKLAKILQKVMGSQDSPVKKVDQPIKKETNSNNNSPVKFERGNLKPQDNDDNIKKDNINKEQKTQSNDQQEKQQENLQQNDDKQIQKPDQIQDQQNKPKETPQVQEIVNPKQENQPSQSKKQKNKKKNKSVLIVDFQPKKQERNSSDSEPEPVVQRKNPINELINEFQMENKDDFPDLQKSNIDDWNPVIPVKKQKKKQEKNKKEEEVEKKSPQKQLETTTQEKQKDQEQEPKNKSPTKKKAPTKEELEQILQKDEYFQNKKKVNPNYDYDWNSDLVLTEKRKEVITQVKPQPSQKILNNEEEFPSLG